ncbi:MAG: hypothetical protein J7K47_02255 [Thermoplasmata archaeon]|nr:hypothetical protein [Thermoplasmata archaeon]
MAIEMFIRNILILAKMCAEDVDNVDMSLFNEMVEFGYIDKKGNLTDYGRKILEEFLKG